MKIGEKVSVHPQTFGKGAMEGKVVYLHPENRYAVVEFEITPRGRSGAKSRRRSGCGNAFSCVGVKSEKC